MEEIVGLRDVRRAQDGEVLYVQSIRAATSSRRPRSHGADVDAEN